MKKVKIIDNLELTPPLPYFMEDEIKKDSSFKIGDLVCHDVFGIGRIVFIFDDGLTFEINFGGFLRPIKSLFVSRP